MKPVLLWSVVAAVALLALESCATQSVGPPVKPLTLSETYSREISNLISSGKPLNAIAEISAIEKSGSTSLSPASLDRLRLQAEDKTVALFKKAVDAKNYQNAVDLYDSAGRYHGTSAFAGWNRAKLLLGLAQSELEKGWNVPALLSFRKALGKGADPGSALSTFADLAIQENDQTTMKEIIAYLTRNKQPVPAAYTKLANEKTTPAQTIPGVVMVWVDLGITLQNGVGVPHAELGTGFFIDRAGYLITNYHVIRDVASPRYRGYSRLFVIPSANSNVRIPARVVGYDKVLDIALLKTEMTPGYVFSFAPQTPMQQGESIFAIGSPGGLQSTMTSGIISANDRHFMQLGNTFQIDASLNPGNSGGPLLTPDAKLVGVNFAGIPEFQGINFSIPIAWVEKILPQLYAGGEDSHPWLGVDVREAKQGLTVIYVVPGSPAAHAGIVPGDIITSIDGKEYRSIVDAQAALLDERPGMLVSVGTLHDGKKQNELVALGNRPFMPLRVAAERDVRQNLFPPLFGMTVQKTGGFLGQTDYRVTKVYPGSIAQQTDLSPGDPITIKGWQVDPKQGVAVLQFYTERQKTAFLGSTVAMAAPLASHNIL